MKQKVTARVLSQKEMAPGIYDMWIETALAKEAKPGQFICVYPKDKSTLLPRPISICEKAENGEALRIVYRVAGKGTAEFSRYEAGEEIDILGCLGNGFPLEAGAGKRVFLMGGGIGVPPILELSKELCADKQIVVGYRDARLFLEEELSREGKVYVATEDGSKGTKGNVMDAIRENALEADVIYACGPTPMLKALKAYAAENGIECWISLEEKMACGIGACLGCVCHSKDVDEHSNVKNKRVCKDGPVFLADEVELLSSEEQRERIAGGCMCGTVKVKED